MKLKKDWRSFISGILLGATATLYVKNQRDTGKMLKKVINTWM